MLKMEQSLHESWILEGSHPEAYDYPALDSWVGILAEFKKAF